MKRDEAVKILDQIYGVKGENARWDYDGAIMRAQLDIAVQLEELVELLRSLTDQDENYNAMRVVRYEP